MRKGAPLPCSPAKAGVQSGPKRRRVSTLWTPAFAGEREGDDERGFTLVEMLVSLSIFAAIAAMGVGLLRSSVDTQDAVQQRLKGMSGLNRVRAVMANDLAQAVQRSTRGPSGEAVPAFLGSASGFAFVHAGAPSDGSARPEVERVGYALVGGEWRAGTGKRYQSLYPADESVNAEIAAAGAEDAVEAVEAADARVIPLPPSSPDLTPIEEMFSKVKEALRSAAARTTGAIFVAIGPALHEISPQDILGWFQSRAAYAMQT